MMPHRITEKWLTASGSTIASLMFILAIIRQYCPPELRRFLGRHTQRFLNLFYPNVNIYIHEFTASRLRRNEAFVVVEAYLSANSSKDLKRLKAEMLKDGSNMMLSMDDHEKVTDEFKGVSVSWMSRKLSPGSSSSSRVISLHPEQERRYYWLQFHEKYRDIVTGAYLEHVTREGKAIIARNRQRRLYTNIPADKSPSSRQTMWSHIAFEHPATFESIAMDPEKKKEIVEDLVTFSKSKDFYARIGKAWKRGYLLYGPPGTGKSTMIAAIANLLKYDVYDLELTAVKDNTELRKLLIETASKSLIVIEDIDCSIDLSGKRKKAGKEKTRDDKEEPILEEEIAGKDGKEGKSSNSKVTLSGLLNFIDGVWSACGGERIIVFTTNYVEKLDPALIRRGRMDKHIELSYCSFEGFKVLAKNYLNMEAHPLLDKIRMLIEEIKITPADVAENLMPKSPRDDPEICLLNLVRALEEAKEEAAKREAKKTEERAKDTKDTMADESGSVTNRGEIKPMVD